MDNLVLETPCQSPELARADLCYSELSRPVPFSLGGADEIGGVNSSAIAPPGVVGSRRRNVKTDELRLEYV